MSKYFGTVGEHTYEMEIVGAERITVDKKEYLLDFRAIESDVFTISLDSKNYRTLIEVGDGESVRVRLLGRTYNVHLQDELHRRLQPASDRDSSARARAEIRAPMPGLVVGVSVRAGDRVKPGSLLLILEAMKMENEIHSLHEGIVAKVLVQKGSAVEKGEVLLTFQ